MTLRDMATRTESTDGDVTIVTTAYDSGLNEVTLYTPSRAPGVPRLLRAVIEQDVAGTWTILGEHPSGDLQYRTLAGALQRATRDVQAAYSHETLPHLMES